MKTCPYCKREFKSIPKPGPLCVECFKLLAESKLTLEQLKQLRKRGRL